MVILLKMKILYYDTLVLVRCPHVIVVQTRTTRVRFLYFLFSFFFILGQHMLFALEAVLFVHSLSLSLIFALSLSLSLGEQPKGYYIGERPKRFKPQRLDLRKPPPRPVPM